jgi:ligand-binding SRPBCC domain-containing protein
MQYRHRFQVRAPLAEVADFHARPSSMAAITPPPIFVRMQQAPAALKTGECMVFTLWAGPLPIQWVARIENVSGTGFTDRQVSGPFASWAHRHTFRLAGGTTEVRDEVQATLRRHVLWAPVGLAMWLGLPLLFRYRAWKTRRLLERAP